MTALMLQAALAAPAPAPHPPLDPPHVELVAQAAPSGRRDKPVATTPAGSDPSSKAPATSGRRLDTSGWRGAALAGFLGLALAATSGMRAFFPLVALSGMIKWGVLSVGPELAWLGSTLAFVTLCVVGVAEIVVLKVPVLHEILDWLTLPARMAVGGAIAVCFALGVEMNPIILGALGVGAAGATGFLTTAKQTVAAGATCGVASHVFSWGEDLASAGIGVGVIWVLVQFSG